MKLIKRNFPAHNDQVIALRRIEGQLRGISKMIEEGKYCIDIINQIRAATNALYGVSEKVFKKHLETCVTSALSNKSPVERKKKIDEILGIFHRMRG